MAEPILSEETLARFWAKVDKVPGGCWLWTASVRNKGYGAFAYVSNGRTVQERAHRISWKLRFGFIPQGLCVLHDCPGGDNPRCVNPEHLFLGTKADNNRDMHRKGRSVPGGTYGRAGYERGDRHHAAKLTAEGVRSIRAAHSAGESLGSISRRLNLAIGHVHRIVHRKAWKHVD
jgi:hypothetical protein